MGFQPERTSAIVQASRLYRQDARPTVFKRTPQRLSGDELGLRGVPAMGSFYPLQPLRTDSQTKGGTCHNGNPVH